MAKDISDSELQLCTQLAKKYEFGHIGVLDQPISEDLLLAIQNNGRVVCTVHDATKDITQSYTSILYFSKERKEYYLIFNGGFGGKDRYGIGPLLNAKSED